MNSLFTIIYIIIYLMRLFIVGAAIFVGYNYAFPSTFGFVAMPYPTAFLLAICINVIHETLRGFR